jgi:hypothetical protein
MKTIRTICLALVAAAIIKVTLYGAPVDPTALYKAGEIEVKAIAFTDTADFRDFDSGGGIAGNYWLTQNLGLGLEAKTLDTDHAFFDTLGANVAARFPLGDSGFAPFGKVGFDWNAEASSSPQARAQFELYLGGGIEKRFSHGITAGVEARILRDSEFRNNEHYQFSVFVGKSF